MRARNLKPGLFTNELLAFAHPLHTIIFAGLWCVADRRGVLEDRPQRIHTLINPGRSLTSTKRSLSWLEEHSFIVRYKVNNLNLIKVLQFSKHQNPHKDEKPSALPDYGASTVPAPYRNGNGTVPAPDETGDNTLPAQKKPEPIGLIPSSLIPDSSLREIPQPPLGKGAVRQRRSGRRAELDEARAKWAALVGSGGKDRDARVEVAIRAIGGWSRIQTRTETDEPRIVREFCDAYVGAAPS